LLAYKGKFKVENDNPYISGGDRARIAVQHPVILLMFVVLIVVAIRGA